MGVDFAFLDSGTGGIPYMLALKEKFPNASCVYLGDTAHFPYGQKTPQEIVSAASQAVKLIEQKWSPKTLVVACNTISVTALDDLRASRLDLLVGILEGQHGGLLDGALRP